MTERHAYFLFAGCALLFIWGTWQVPLLGPDEPRYAQVSREMFETGEYFVPRLGGLIWFEKPVLLYWLIALSYALFGVHEFSARLPSVMVAVGTVWFLHFTLRKIAGPVKAVLASAVLATTAFFISFSHASTFDMLLSFCVTASLCSYLLYEQKPERSGWLMMMYVFAGLGVLAKGFVALIIIGLTLVAYLTITKRWNQVLSMKPLQGALITACVIAVWFLPVSLISGVRFWDEFVYQHHFVRYTSSYYHRSQGVLFYIPILIAGTYPWSFAPFVAKPNGNPDLVRFAFCWLLGSFLFFSFSKTKLPGYILPIVPAFAILAGLSLAGMQSNRRMVVLSIALQLILIAGLVWGVQKYELPIQPLFWAVGIITVFTAAGIFFLTRKQFSVAWITQVLILISGIGLFLYAIFPQLAWSDSRTLSVQWIEQTPGTSKLVPYNVYDFGPLFYTNGRMQLDPKGYPKILTDASQLHRYMMQHGGAHVFTGNDDLQWMQQAHFWRVETVLKGRERSILVLRPK